MDKFYKKASKKHVKVSPSNFAHGGRAILILRPTLLPPFLQMHESCSRCHRKALESIRVQSQMTLASF